MRVKTFYKILVLCLFFLLQAFAGAQPAAKPLVKIGLIMPLSGSMAHVGTAFRDAARMAAQELPGDLHFQYELDFEDDQLQSAKASSAAHKLLEIDKVDALISTWSYGGAVVAPLAENTHVPHIGIAWDPVVAKGRFNFIHAAPPREFIKSFFEGFKKKGYHRIASVGWQESGSLFFLDEFDRLSKAAGFEVAKRVEFNIGDLDFRVAILGIEKTKPDIYLLNLSAPEIDLFIRQMNELHVSTPVTAITGFEVANDLKPLEGKWYVSDATAPDSFIERFQKQYGHNHVYGVGNYYDAVKLLVFLYEHAYDAGPSTANHKPSGEDAIKMMTKLPEFSSIFGPLWIDEEGIISYKPVFRKIEKGKRVTVGLDGI